jgi:26S proteasome regulatory subunit N6
MRSSYVPDQAELQQDPLIRTHLTVLYDTLLEQNLIRVIEPYSSVELSWIAQEVGQDVQVVEDKLSQMILDQVFYGVLNENEGTLEVYDEPTEDVRLLHIPKGFELMIRSCSPRR